MPDPRAKPLCLVQGHRTKAEIEAREKNEKAMSTSEKMKPSAEVRADTDALKIYKRLKKIFTSIEMDEAFYEGGLSRYCLMQAEHARLLEDRNRMRVISDRIYTLVDEGEIEKADMLLRAEAAVNEKEKAIAKLRDQMLAFERENLMTVQGKLRAIPKKAAEKELSDIEMLMARRAMR